MAVPTPYLLQCYGFGSVPQRMAAVRFEPVLRPDSQNREQQLGREFSWRQGRQVEKWEMVVKTTDVALQEPIQCVP